MTIKTALLWFVFVLLVLNIVYHLHQVAEGKHMHEVKPTSCAISAVVYTILAMLWWFYVLH